MYSRTKWPSRADGSKRTLEAVYVYIQRREIECLLYDSHQKGKMMIMIMKTSGSQVDSPRPTAGTMRTETEGMEMCTL